jgi:hypothetical protein
MPGRFSAHWQQGGTGSPKHALSVNLDHGERNHAPNRTRTRFSFPHNGAKPPERFERVAPSAQHQLRRHLAEPRRLPAARKARTQRR